MQTVRHATKSVGEIVIISILFFISLIQDREPFDVPDEVTWQEMSEALNARWRLTTERDLRPEHLMYLKEKIFTNIAGILSHVFNEVY